MENSVENNNEEVTVEVIGGNAEPQTTETIDAQIETAEEVGSEAKEEVKQETVDTEDKGDKTEKIDAKDEIKEQIKDKDETEKPFKVSFGEKKDETKKPVTEEKKETLTVTDEKVLEFLKEKGIEVNSVSELSPKVELSDEVKKFQQFHKETGRGHKDFYNSQKNWNDEPKDETIKQFLKLKHNFSDENIEKHIGLLKISEDEEDTLSDRDLTRRQLEYDEKYNEALGFMTEKSKEWKTSLDNRESQHKPMTEEDIIEAHKPYWGRRDKSLESLTEVKMSLGEMGDINVSVTQEQKDIISKYTQTQEAFFERFRDDKGKINTDQSNEAIMWGTKELREPMLAEMFEQAYVLFMDSFSKQNRSVDLKEVKKQPKPTNEKGSFEVLGGNDGTGNMGKPLL